MKIFCGEQKWDRMKIYYKCHSSDEYYWYYKVSGLKDPIPSNLCSNDPVFYQFCGTDEMELDKISKFGEKTLCGSYLCETQSGEILTTYEVNFLGLTCNGRKDCLNTDLDENKEVSGCTSVDVDNKNETLPSGKIILSNKVCDGNCDDRDCEDEANCRGYRYGLYCKVLEEKNEYIYPFKICDGDKECDYGEDESNCAITEDTQFTCEKDYPDETVVPVLNITRCYQTKEEVGPTQKLNFFAYCRDSVWYQSNCSDLAKVGAECNINGYKSTVSKFMICRGEKGCDDNLEDICIDTSSTCTLHKHFTCDDKNDCADKSDETDPSCGSKTLEKCKRRAGRMEELPIPLTWLKDGLQDCVNGEDEEDIWPTCGIEKSQRFVVDNKTCQNVYICPWSKPGYVDLDRLCDGIETCGNENKVCSKAQGSKALFSSAMTTNQGLKKHISYCIRGIEDTLHFNGTCKTTSFIFPDHDFFGVETRTTLILPKEKQNCDFMYGEQYVYTSCESQCSSSPCPLKNIPRYEVCPGQYRNRVGTLANNTYLAFFVKSSENIFTNRLFVCNNKLTCLDYSKVCNLVDDCGDGSDEENCTNHFKCNSTGTYIPKTSKCDGAFDCMDASDECNDQCNREILEGRALKGLCWTIGILAVIANTIIIAKNASSLKKCQSTVALINKSLIMMISFGDLLVGGYLFVISIYDAFILRDYCKKQMQWITSMNCSVIGVVGNIGSQISLFSMVALSVTRIHGIYNSMRIPGEANFKKSLQVALGLCMIAVASISISVVPIITSFEDYFVNGVKYSESLRIFIGTLNKDRLSEIFKAYFGRMKSTTLSWQMINKMMAAMFTHDLDYKDHTLKIEKVDFYGNDGVCLFKYFVKDDDPQRNMVWAILAVNFMCFFVIAVSYFIIGIISFRSSKSLTSSSVNQQITQRNRKMNMRISIIITTDFLCWVPFIVICVLHSLEVLDATPWYSLFSVVILPINSVINPLIYDDTLTALFNAFGKRLKKSKVFQMLKKRLNKVKRRKVDLEMQGKATEGEKQQAKGESGAE